MLTGVQTAESFLAWREGDGKKPQLAKSIPTPITIELQKGPPELGVYGQLFLFNIQIPPCSPTLPPSPSLPPPPFFLIFTGIEIEGGLNRGTAEIYIKELKPEGAGRENGLLKASVDGGNVA